MKYLTIIRHAKSSWDHPDLDDIARPLNERGKHAVKIIGKHLQEQVLQPDLIISSPATRALETAKAISEFVAYDKKKIIDLQNNKDLIDTIISQDSNMYRFTTIETLSFLGWLRRFADGLIEGDE